MPLAARDHAMKALPFDRLYEPLGIEDHGDPGGRDSPPGDSRCDLLGGDSPSQPRPARGSAERGPWPEATWFRHGRHPTLSGDSLASAVSPAIRGRTGRGRVSRRPASHQHMPDLVRQFARGVGVSRQASPLASFAPPGRAATRPPVARLPLNGLGGGRDCFCRVAPPES